MVSHAGYALNSVIHSQKAHHHHKHPEGYIHDPLEHPAHLHEDYHPSLGHHHLHITDEDHHVYDSATGYFGSLDESLGGDADGPYPIWNGTAWTYDHLEQEVRVKNF